MGKQVFIRPKIRDGERPQKAGERADRRLGGLEHEGECP